MKNDVLAILQSIRPEADFSASQDFLADGLLDSFDLMVLVSELDQRYDISIAGADIVPEHFANLDTIIALLKKNGVDA